MDSTSIMDKVHDQDIVVIEHVSAGKQPAIWYQDAVYSMSYVLKRISKINENDIKGIWFPNNGELKLVSIDDFKEIFNNIKALV